MAMDLKTKIKWLARIIGGIAICVYAFWLFSEGDTLMIRSFLLVLGFGTSGYLFAWFREKEGGIVMLISGILMGMYMFYSISLNPVALFLKYSIPFVVPGIMFWWTGNTSADNKE